MKSKKTKTMVYITLFASIELVLMLTPLGYVPLGPIRATTLHIPVILAGVLLGPKPGMAIGLVFGLTSLITNTLTPTITSFVFSPFVSGSLFSLIIVLGPRIFLGWLSGIIANIVKKKATFSKVGLFLHGVAMTLIHTTLVLGCIYLFFGQSYSSAIGISLQELLPFFIGIIITNSIAEAILAGFVLTAIGMILLPKMKETNYDKSSEK